MIALIDCNNFYVSCEQVFNPMLLGKALLVLSNNDGCAISRSEEAKKLGITMGTPAFMIEEKIREYSVEVRSSNYTLYGDMSERVMQVIRQFFPKTEVYSIDEVFADLKGLSYVNLNTLATEVREAVKSHTGITVSIGIAPTKTLSKLANRYAKKTRRSEGVFYAEGDDAISGMLSCMDVGEIWGIGAQHAALLKASGFHTAADFLNAPEEWVRKNLSVVGQRTQMELKGTPAIPWEEKPPARKNICTARSFGKLVTTKKEMSQAVAAFTTNCAGKLRKENTCARVLHVFVQTNIHRKQDAQYFQSLDIQLPVPSNSSAELVRASMEALDKIWRPGYQYGKAGVMMLDLVPASTLQMNLFTQQKKKKDAELMKTLDEVNKSFGRDVVRFGVQDYGTHWKLRQEHLSQRFTTRLDQLPKAQ